MNRRDLQLNIPSRIFERAETIAQTGVEVGSRQTGLGYTGEWQGADHKFVYLRARWYLVEDGRFSSPDTIVPDYRNPQSLNYYSYVLDNPLIFVDPSGHRLRPPPGWSP